jgi:cAMP-specific phosphodiesterase 4
MEILMLFSCHAADVLQTVQVLLLSDLALARNFKTTEIFAACIASAVHDIDHPGVNNNFLIQSQHKMAILYNDISVLEYHHASRSFEIASTAETNIFKTFTKAQCSEIRKLIIGMVVATGI